jgi:hypothetical protein
MRDPGTPGRNPFFDHGPDAEFGDLGPEPDEAAVQFDEEIFAAFPFLEGPDPTLAEGAIPGAGRGASAAGADPLGTLAAFVDALQGAQPEATEHLVAAAHELVLAVKTVVDATEAVLAAQRASVGIPPDAADDASDTVPDPFSSAPEPPRTSGVRRIDLA